MMILEVTILDFMIVLFVFLSLFSVLSIVLALWMVRRNTHIRKYVIQNQEKAYLKSKHFENDEKNKRHYYLVFTLRNGETFHGEVRQKVYDNVIIEQEATVAIENEKLLFFEQKPVETEWTE